MFSIFQLLLDYSIIFILLGMVVFTEFVSPQINFPQVLCNCSCTLFEGVFYIIFCSYLYTYPSLSSCFLVDSTCWLLSHSAIENIHEKARGSYGYNSPNPHCKTRSASLGLPLHAASLYKLSP